MIGVTVVLEVGLAWAASRTCEERLERLPVPPVVLGVGLAWAASRTCEERLQRLPVPPDAMPGMTNLRRVLESGLTTLATALGGVRGWRQIAWQVYSDD